MREQLQPPSPQPLKTRFLRPQRQSLQGRVAHLKGQAQTLAFISALSLLSACGSSSLNPNATVVVQPNGPVAKMASINACGASHITALQCASPVTQLEAEAHFCDGTQKTDAAKIQVIAASEASQGAVITASAQGGFANYALAVNCAGIYDLTFTLKAQSANTATHTATHSLSVMLDGQPVGAVNPSPSGWSQVQLKGMYFSGGTHNLELVFADASVALDTFTLTSTENNTLTATDIVRQMGTGINLGNTLDLPPGEDWGAQPEAEHYFDDFKTAGFGHVRIPVTWDGAAALTPPYTIDPAFFERVETTVDWALARGFFVVLNAHHEKWFKEDYPTQNGQPTDATPTPAQAAIIAENNARLAAIWVQMAEYFQHKPQRLVFEMLNEPFGMTTAQVDALNPQLLAIIRKTNPNRAVVFSGAGFTPYDELTATQVPQGTNLIGNFHSYDPWAFGGQCAVSWGSDSDKAKLRQIYQQVADWSALHGIPVTVNEFSAALYDWENPKNICNPQDRQAYIRYHVELQKEFGMAGTVWDDDGSFRIYDRKNRTWDPVVNSLIF